MRLLLAIPHYFHADPGGAHASQRGAAQARLAALTACLTNLHQHFGAPQRLIHIGERQARLANQATALSLEIVVCTARDRHLLADLPLPPDRFHHHPTQADPLLLGFECQDLLRSALGQYDLFGYLEDDLLIHDPWFFAKLTWFTAQAGETCLLQPNRYETHPQHPTRKVYIDGDLAPHVTAPYQDVTVRPQLSAQVLGQTVHFRRALNPHSGCFFLTAAQLAHWSSQPHFWDRQTSFIGPLESAATLGIMRAFQVYKPAPENANFFEIQHYGSAFLSLLGTTVSIA